MCTSTPSDFPATTKHCSGHGNRARDVKWIHLWRSCLCVLIKPSCTSHKHLVECPEPSWIPSFLPSFSFPVLTQGWFPQCNPCIRITQNKFWMCPGCDSSFTALLWKFHVSSTFYSCFQAARSQCLPLRSSKNCPCPPPPVYQLISLIASDTGALQPYLQSLDTFVCILLPLMFNEGSDIMVLEKQCFSLHKQNEVTLGKRKPS